MSLMPALVRHPCILPWLETPVAEFTGEGRMGRAEDREDHAVFYGKLI
ncbi:hypothetical protein [Nitrosospira sp. Nsp1]|nr:hypothetical protein [Nitrosospira sp. Nsp1]SCX52991.1 hypothetical protein SAMN05720354_11259 [Nitrosospira sp. Nsp1]